MASLAGLKRRLKALRPRVESAFIVYLTPRESPVKEVDQTYEIVQVTDPDDPLLPKISPKWQHGYARRMLGQKRGRVIVALHDGEPIGRIWEIFDSERALFAGVPRVKLAPGETFMFDLFVERAHRRSNIGMTMADYFFRLYEPETTKVNYVYGFINYENAPSILWHHSIGFNVAQTINYLAIGERIKWKLPFSDMPRFGPMSRKGRHTDPDKDLFGTSLLPNL
jgi:hypothetical protein